VKRIESARPHILLVAFGAPAQDMWIATHLKSLPTVRIAMGVGGTFDFLAGDVRRAPLALRILGLEWLWRLILEPWRWKRIWTAVVTFPWLVLRYGKEGPIQL
jgi:N-acetylglucosaminyldiphosphoundecaprenol N-acetyl-beta-D-mannosaminyltransferase